MKWYQVSEHLPPEGKLFMVYSEVHGKYYYASFCSARGWLDQDKCSMKIVTHWCDFELPMPFPVLEQPDEELAKKYGFQISQRSSLFGS